MPDALRERGRLCWPCRRHRACLAPTGAGRDARAGSEAASGHSNQELHWHRECRVCILPACLLACLRWLLAAGCWLHPGPGGCCWGGLRRLKLCPHLSSPPALQPSNAPTRLQGWHSAATACASALCPRAQRRVGPPAALSTTVCPLALVGGPAARGRSAWRPMCAPPQSLEQARPIAASPSQRRKQPASSGLFISRRPSAACLACLAHRLANRVPVYNFPAAMPGVRGGERSS